MKKLFLDTNVFLDYFMAREPQGPFAAKLFSKIMRGQYSAATSAVSFCNVAYILGRIEKQRRIELDLQEIIHTIEIIPNTSMHLDTAMNLPLPDYEDAVQYVSALQGLCTHLISANIKHFKHCKIPVLSPQQFIENEF